MYQTWTFGFPPSNTTYIRVAHALSEILLGVRSFSLLRGLDAMTQYFTLPVENIHAVACALQAVHHYDGRPTWLCSSEGICFP